MNDLTLSYEPATGEAIINGPPAGAAGEAGLAPVDGVEFAFDRADGHLVRVIVSAASESEQALLSRLFGAHARRVLHDARQPAGTGPLTLAPRPGLCAALSSLARLDAARATSPVWASPWWDAEGAVLAEAVGLHDRALAEARRAVRILGQDQLAVPANAARTARAAADIAARADPETARLLCEGIVVVDRPHPAGIRGLDVAAEVEDLANDCARTPSLHWVLDPALAPARLFQPGLSPHSDLLVSHDVAAGRVLVQVTIAAGADRAEASRWHARLVDSAVRRVLAKARLAAAGPVLQAELNQPFPLTELPETWVEVVEEGNRPVRSAKAHRIAQALRWADAALRAERAPAGLSPQATNEDWSALAAAAWQRCGRDWAAAGDPGRAAAAQPAGGPLPSPEYLAERFGE
jgi:hypothetical protein